MGRRKQLLVRCFCIGSGVPQHTLAPVWSGVVGPGYAYRWYRVDYHQTDRSTITDRSIHNNMWPGASRPRDCWWAALDCGL